MINYVFASEFDILKGSLIRSYYPPCIPYFNECLLASYMIPDGAHKHQYDINFFKYSLPNSKLNSIYFILKESNPNIQLVKFNKKSERWENFFNEHSNIKFSNTLILFKSNCFFVKKFEDDKNFYKIEIHKDIQMVKLNDTFCSFYTKEGISLGINFESPKFADLVYNYCSEFEKNLNYNNDNNYSKGIQNEEIKEEKNCFFYNIIKNKKDSSIKRGSLIRSLAICSNECNIFHEFEELIKYFLDIFTDFPIDDKNDKILDDLLQNMFKTINLTISEIKQAKILKISEKPMNYTSFLLEKGKAKFFKKVKLLNNETTNIEFSQSLYKNYLNVSLLDFVKKFGERTIIIYNAILRESKILFIGHETSNFELCSLVACCSFLVYPLNISNKIFGYQHLLDLNFLNYNGYIAGVSNPLFYSKQDWWDICCDVNSGNIIENNQRINKKIPEKDDFSKLLNIDYEFIQEVLKKIKEGSLDEYQIREVFYNFTQNWIDLFVNSSNVLDYEKDNKNLLEALQIRTNLFKKTKFFNNFKKYNDNLREELLERFGNKYIHLHKALTIYFEKNTLDNYNLIFLYNNFVDCLENTSKENVKFFIELLLAKKKSCEGISVGLFSQIEEVVKKNLKLFEIFENIEEGKLMLSKFNFYILFIYQSLKNKFRNFN